jgi:hypothetical protein
MGASHVSHVIHVHELHDYKNRGRGYRKNQKIYMKIFLRDFYGKLLVFCEI